MRDVSDIDLSTEILQQKLALPLVLAPVGFAGVFARRGEVQAAKAAAAAQIPFCLSAVGICSLEEVAKTAPFWFQFYMLKNRGYALDLLQRAKTARCPILVVTVDLPMAGARHRYEGSRKLHSRISFFKSVRWWIDVRLKGGPLTIGNLPSQAPVMHHLGTMRQWMGSQISQNFTWDNFEWIRQHWLGKIVIKGILDAEDARLAKQAGADGIVVSNHGGRIWMEHLRQLRPYQQFVKPLEAIFAY